MQDTLVIIPTYNEKENIEKIIRATFSQKKSFDILVVDDSSPDGTADIVKKLQEEYPKSLFLEIRNKKDGLGRAYIHGFKWAIKRKYDYCSESDAEFSHNPRIARSIVREIGLKSVESRTTALTNSGRVSYSRLMMIASTGEGIPASSIPD